MILNAVEGKALPIYGDGGNVRDWLYVEDHCEGILLALQRGRPGEKYNIGGGNERTNLQVVDALCATLDRELPAAKNPALAGRQELRGAEDVREGPSRPRPPLRDRRGQDPRRAGLAAEARLRGGPRRDRALVPGEPAPGAKGCRRAGTRASGWGSRSGRESHPDRAAGGRRDRARRTPRSARLLPRDLPPAEIRRPRDSRTPRAGQPLELREGHAARASRPAPASAGQAGTRRAWRDVRCSRRHPPWLADLRALGGRGPFWRELPPALDPARLRPRVLRAQRAGGRGVQVQRFLRSAATR